MLAAPPEQVNRVGIVVIAALSVAGAAGILALGRRYTVAVSHGTSVIATVMIAAAVAMTGGTLFGALYAVLYLWVVLFSLLFCGRRGTVGHAVLCSVAAAVGLAGLPPAHRA